MLTMQPIVNSSAQTVFPADDGDNPRLCAAPVIFPANATPILGRHERMPAIIAIARPTANLLELDELDLSVAGNLLDPAIEHWTMPTMTSALPTRRTSPLIVRRVWGKKMRSGMRAPKLEIRPMMMG